MPLIYKYRFAVHGLFTVITLCISAYSIKGPKFIIGCVGEDAVFKWNTTNQTTIFSASWGIRNGDIADPQFINVNTYTGNMDVNSDLDETIKSRVGFLGNLRKGRAWFVLRNLTVNDTNEYIASMSADGATLQPYPVSLVVTPKKEMKPTEGYCHTTNPTDVSANISIKPTEGDYHTTVPTSVSTNMTTTEGSAGDSVRNINDYLMLMAIALVRWHF